jgi:hypothetical protein
LPEFASQTRGTEFHKLIGIRCASSEPPSVQSSPTTDILGGQFRENDGMRTLEDARRFCQAQPDGAWSLPDKTTLHRFLKTVARVDVDYWLRDGSGWDAGKWRTARPETARALCVRRAPSR